MIYSSTIPLRYRAFTLIELLVTLTLLTILITLAVPTSRHLFLVNQQAAQMDTLGSALNYARSQAIFRQEKTVFCKSADHKTCGGDWRNGQIILNEKGAVLRVLPALPKNTTLVWNSSGGSDNAVTWLPSGYTNGQRGTFYYCVGSQDVAHSQSLVLLNTGRWYTSTMSAGDYAKFCGVVQTLE